MNWHTQASLRSPGAGGPVPAPKLVAREAPGLWGEGLVQAPTEPTPVLRVPQACPQETLSLDPQLDVAPPGHTLLFTDEETAQEPRSSESAERGPLPPRDPRGPPPRGPTAGPQEGRQPSGGARGPRGAVRGGGGGCCLQGTRRGSGETHPSAWPRWWPQASKGGAVTLGPRGHTCPPQTSRRAPESPGKGTRGGQHRRQPTVCGRSRAGEGMRLCWELRHRSAP